MRKLWCWIVGHVATTDCIEDNLRYPWSVARDGEPTAKQEVKIGLLTGRKMVRDRVCLRCEAALGAQDSKEKR